MKESLLNHIGWKYNKKSGFTLIELNISMFIQLLVLTIAINTMVLIIKNHSGLIDNSKVEDPFDDAILNIERLLTANMIESIVIKEDTENRSGEIEISYRIDNDKVDIKKKRLYFSSTKNKIILETYKNNYKIGYNTIMTDVSNFKIIKKDRLYYLKITNLNNYERIICL